MRLDFVGVGPRRTGTTWIHVYLETVPDVFVPAYAKETYYFDRHFEQGEEWYRSQFRLPDPLPGSACIGEVCPSYFNSAAAADRIHDLAPGCRVIVSLRHPYERLRSNYHLARRSGATKEASLGAALEANPSMLEQSRYATHLGAWIERFENVHVLFYDDLVADPRRYVGHLSEAMDRPLPPIPPQLVEHRAASGHVPGRPRLELLYRTGVRRLRRAGMHRTIHLLRRLRVPKLAVRRLPLPEERPEIPGWAKDLIREEVAGLGALGVETPDWDLS